MHPGSLREFSALFWIIVMNSSMRSGLISASTIIPNDFDMLSAVLEIALLLEARKVRLLALVNEEEGRRSNKQALESNFILVFGT
jgi:hypothetical protein